MSTDPPLHPGPRPPDLHFPFDDAEDLVVQARSLADDLRRLERQIASETGLLATTPFEGWFARWFLDQRMEAARTLRDLAHRLEQQADMVDALAATAHRRIDDRVAEVQHWDWQVSTWRAAQSVAGAA